MSKVGIFRKIKQATVAMAVLHEGKSQKPYTIIGSGFCIHPRGVIVTCKHVLSAFFNKDFEQLIAEIPDVDKKRELQPLANAESVRPYALFFTVDHASQNLVVIPVPVETGMAKIDSDLGLVRIAVHATAIDGYPVLEVEGFDSIYEGMGLGTCGFPLGNLMAEQIGTIASSFTQGTLSSIIPVQGVAKEHVKGFQLDLTATHGNSGGPVFSLDSGKVFGVLQSGVVSNEGRIVPGFTKAEPIYPLLDDRIMKDILSITEDEIRKRMGA